MFDLIRKIRAEQTGLPIQPAPAELSDRLKIVNEVVSHLYKKAVPQSQADLTVSMSKMLDFGYFAQRRSNTEVSALFLIDPEEIPHEFRFTGVDDPRLNDQNLLNSYSNWLYDKLGLPITIPVINLFFATVSLVRPMMSRDFVKAQLLFLQDKEKAKEALKFVLMHELGHYHNNDSKSRRIALYLEGVVSISWPILVALALSWPIAWAIPFVLTAAAASYFALSRLIAIVAWRSLERKADAFAAEHLPESIDGRIHYLKIRLEAFGDRFDLEHPSLSKRIAAMEVAKQQHRLEATRQLYALAGMFESGQHLEVESAMKQFLKLPAEPRNRVYGKLYPIIQQSLPGDYWRCAEDAFHDRANLSSTLQQKSRAILDASAELMREAHAK